MELHWYSPLNARESEIARYSEIVLPALSERACLSRVLDPHSDYEPDWVSALSPAGSGCAGQAALPIYHIGNNPLHFPVWQQSLEVPGLVVLHDAGLLDLARYASRKIGHPSWWKHALRQQYGDTVKSIIREAEQNADSYTALALDYPLFKPFVQGALGIVVHSRSAGDQLQKALPYGPPIIQLDLPAPAPPVPAERDYAGALRFVFCGHVGPNRRLEQFLEAWSMLEHPDRIALDIYGHVGNSTELMRHATRCGVASRIALHGYVDSEELDRALARAHFALNLRWPTMGEASASQLRYWSAGLPTLVTDVGWYGELPDDAVCKISPEDEVAGIAAFLNGALDQPQKYREVGLRGWERVNEVHSIDAYVDGLLDFSGCVLAERLARGSLDRGLVPLVASMCRLESDVKMFHSAIQRAVSTFETGSAGAEGGRRLSDGPGLRR